MDANAISSMVTAVINLLPDKTVKDFLDAGFDKIEDTVADSTNKIDDAVVLPLMKKIRKVLDVPDND